MTIFDQQSYLALPQEARDSYIGSVVDTKNNYIAFKEEEKDLYNELVKEIQEKGRSEVDFSKYTQSDKIERVQYNQPQDQKLKKIPDILANLANGDEKIKKILNKIDDPKTNLSLKECKVLFKEIFKNYERN